jgi:2-hydroxy-6-oxonona-2,4-dienedioate hydrolase
MTRPPTLAAVLVIVAAALLIAALAIGSSFERDLALATERSAQGSTVAATRCGRIEYAQTGQGLSLLMIHGSGGGHDQGMAFAGSFVHQGMRVIAPSRFGYLGTPLPADASPAAQADAHACLLDALGIRQVAVLGASAGALSAMQLAIRHPERVSALILLVPLAYRPMPTVQAAPSPWAERILLSLIGSDFVYWSAMQLARDQLIQRVLATPPEVVAAASPLEQARVNAMIDSILPVSARAEGLRNETKVAKNLQPYDLAAIRAPTLLISARDDGYGTYGNAEYTAGHIAGAKFIGFEQGGHLWVGHDDEVRREIIKHVLTHGKL